MTVDAETPAPMRSNASGATNYACECCGTGFERRKRWQRFCSNKCRQDFHRQKASIDREVHQLRARVEVLEAEVKDLREAMWPVSGHP